MRKFLLILVFLTLGMVSSFSAPEFNLENDHGEQLDKASYAIRLKFSKLMNVDWYKSTYQQRRHFLENWYVDLERDTTAQKISAEEKKLAEDRRLEAKRADDRAAAEKLKQRKEIAKAEAKEAKEKKKQFNQKTKDREDKLEQMRRIQKSTKNK